MKVYLIGHSHSLDMYHPKEKLADVGAAICIDKHDKAWVSFGDCPNLAAAIKSGHLSVIEHIALTFLIEDVSRACTHQLVRHRIASYSQLSQRYAKVDADVTNEWFVTPESIKDNIFIHDKYVDMMDEIADLYNAMCEDGIPNEDARMILPNACFTSIVMTMNARAFIEASTKRVCNKAQWEIRELFKRMRELIRETFPTVYKLSGPECTKSGCKEAKPCGKMECSHG